MRSLIAAAAISLMAPNPSLWAQASAPASALPIELLGVMVDAGTPSQSTCLIRCTGPAGQGGTAILGAGQHACALAEIKAIGQDAVVVRNLLTGRLERLVLPRDREASAARAEPSSPAEPVPPTIVQASSSQVTVEVPKASVAQYLANLPELLNSTVATPRYRDAGGVHRSIDGFTLSQIRDGSVADRVGLENGDTIVALNGEKLDSLDIVLRILGQAQNVAQVTLAVERNGELMRFVIRTK